MVREGRERKNGPLWWQTEWSDERRINGQNVRERQVRFGTKERFTMSDKGARDQRKIREEWPKACERTRLPNAV